MANLSNINNKFLVTTGGNVLIGQTAAVGTSIFQVTGTSTLAGRVTVEATSAVTNGVVDTLVVKALSSGAITNGFGVGLSFYNENTVYSAVNEVGKIAVVETDTIAVDDKMVFSVKDNNILAERLTLTGSEAIFTGNVTVGNSGNINIPTASSGNANLNFDGTDFKITSNSSSANLKLETSSTTRLTINSSGKIAIGNNIPMWSGQYGGALFLKGNNGTSDRHVQLTTVDSTGASIGTGLVVKGISVGIGTEEISNLLSIKGSGQNWGSSPAIKLWDTTYGKGWYVGTANNDVAGDYYIR